jgi:hypothetical protein
VILCAFDLATVTGVCDGAVGGKPRLFSWYLADGGPSRPARLAQLRSFLVRYLVKEKPDGVVYEAPMPLGMLTSKKDKRVMMSEANVAFARGAIGVLEATCFEHGKPVEALGVMDARSCVLGWRTNRTSEQTKARVVREARMLGAKAAENDNETDAWVLWSYACARSNPRLAVAMTPLFAQLPPSDYGFGRDWPAGTKPNGDENAV